MDSMTRRAAAVVMAWCLTGASGPAFAADAPQVKFATSQGDIVVEVYPEKAPATVENFLQYVKDKHYDGTIFHRVIDHFMIQGGGLDSNMIEKRTRAPVAHEGREALAKGGPRNVVGTLAMARTNDPNSATAQFFINVNDNTNLDPVLIPPGDPVPRFQQGGRVYENVPRSQLLSIPQLYGYTVFGKVVSGMEVVNRIAATPTGVKGFHRNVPVKPVVITSATVLN